jgi:ABC-type uncharacterized transport system ATPase subunit
MLEMHGLRKSFGGLVAVNNVSFAIEPGQILGLLGRTARGRRRQDGARRVSGVVCI